MRVAAIAIAGILAACGGGTPAKPEPPVTTPAAPKTQADEPAKPDTPPPTLAEQAQAIAHETIILDGHVDLPWRLEKSRAPDGSITENVAERTPEGDFDWVRAREGGLDAPFMSIFVAARYEMNGAKKVADELIDMVEAIASKNPDKFALARSPADVKANFAAGKVSLPMGMENGAPLQGKLDNVEHFYDRGIRYITLAHSKDNHLSDSSYDDRHTHKGLTKFGKKVVAEMNRLGIMVDVSHLSDEAFWDVMEVSEVPVIASHSSCRHFTPGWERNMSDEMIEALAKKGGVIQINFGSQFIDDDIRKQRSARWDEIDRLLKENGMDREDHDADTLIDEYDDKHPIPNANVGQVADHIDHVVKLVGIDHVGLGSDFDGVGDTLPDGLKDVSYYPKLIEVLLQRGYARSDIEKILSGNVLRVWQRVEDHARKGG